MHDRRHDIFELRFLEEYLPISLRFLDEYLPISLRFLDE